MYVKEYGRGDRFFAAFHGWGGTHREFVPLASRMPNDARLLSFDLPGYGDSPEPEAWDLDAIAANLGQELELRAGGRPCTLIGFCSGSVFALLLAQRKQASVERIVLIDPFAYVPWYFRIFLWGEFGRRAYSVTFQTHIGRTITDRIFRRIQKQDTDFTAAFRDMHHAVVRNYLKLFHQIDMRRFHDLTVPIDLLYGESTFAEVRRSVEWYCGLWPHAGKTVLRDVGHLPLFKGARQLASVIFDQERAVRES
jgi:pimeloyl-ACP methyl ester carboxylesterase